MSQNKEKWVEEILQAAETIERAKAGAGFYNGVVTRIKVEAVVSTDYVLRIAAGLFLLIALNVFACVSFSKKSGINDNTHLQAFAKEYSITSGNDNF